MPMKWFLDKTFSGDEAEALKTIAGTANEGIWIIDISGNTLFVNEKMAASLGYEIEGLQRLNISDITEMKTGALELKNQKEILQAVVEAGNYLFSEPDILMALDGIVSTIGVSFELDRCFVYGKGLTQSFIQTKMLQLSAYINENSALTVSNYDCFEFVNCESCFDGIQKAILDNGFYESNIEKADKPILTLSEYGISYILVFPLFVQDDFWGIFGLSRTEGRPAMNDIQKTALSTMSKNIASAVEKFFVTRL